jgi:hypothetical protein
MKIRKRLASEVAKKLGLKVKKNDGDGKNAKYSLNDDQLNQLNQISNVSNLSVKGKSTLRNKDGEVVLEWVKTEITKEQQIENLRQAIIGLILA